MSDPADLEHQIKLDYEMMLDDPSFDVNSLAEQDMQHPSFGASPFGWPMPAIPQDNPFAEGSHFIILTVKSKIIEGRRRCNHSGTAATPRAGLVRSRSDAHGNEFTSPSRPQPHVPPQHRARPSSTQAPSP